MSDYVVYGLYDPRDKSLFYVGQGSSPMRMYQHKASTNSKKGKRIKEIEDEGLKVDRRILVDNINEISSIRVEASIIGTIGTTDTGGPLLNAIVPKGNYKSVPQKINCPSGLIEKSVLGRSLIEDAILCLLEYNPGGLTNGQICNILRLNSIHDQKAINYLSYSLLGSLVAENKLIKLDNGKKYPIYKTNH